MGLSQHNNYKKRYSIPENRYMMNECSKWSYIRLKEGIRLRKRRKNKPFVRYRLITREYIERKYENIKFLD